MNIQFSKQNINKSDLNDVISILKSSGLLMENTLKNLKKFY